MFGSPAPHRTRSFGHILYHSLYYIIPAPLGPAGTVPPGRPGLYPGPSSGRPRTYLWPPSRGTSRTVHKRRGRRPRSNRRGY